MGEKLKRNIFYIKAANGKYIPYEGLTGIGDIVCRDEIDAGTYDVLYQGGTFEFDIRMTKEECRKVNKHFRKHANILRRRIRYDKRLKEYARRRKLKGARYL